MQSILSVKINMNANISPSPSYKKCLTLNIVRFPTNGDMSTENAASRYKWNVYK